MSKSMSITSVEPSSTVQSGKQGMSRRKAVGLGCLIAVLGPVAFIGWGVLSYFSAPQPAWSVAWSPDGKMLAAGYGGFGSGGGIPGPPQDYTVRIWNIDQLGKPKVVLTNHTSRVLAVAFSPDGKHLATGDEWGTTHLWDQNDLKTRPTVMDDDVYPDTGSQQLAFSPDGRWLVGGGGSFEEVGAWDVTDPLAPSIGLIAPGAYLSHAGFMPDNKRVVAVSDEGLVGFWDRTAPGAKPTMLPKAGEGVPGVGGVHVIAVSKDGQQVAGAGEEGTMWLWDLRQPEAKAVSLPGKLEERTAAIDFSPDGNKLVASASDEYGIGRAFVWDMTDKSKEPEEIRGAEGHTTDLKFSPDGKWLAASGYDGSVRVWGADKLGDNPRNLGR
jgi:WD40 repeat protein